MAELEYAATPQANGSVSVARSTGTSVLGGATVSVVIDNSKTKLEVRKALEGAIRALSRDENQGDAPADYPTTTTTVE